MRRNTIIAAGSASIALLLPGAAAAEAPLTPPDFYRMPSTKQTLVVPHPGILANDTDADGDPLTVIIIGEPDWGDLVMSRHGGFRYTPDPGFSGLDSFIYLARDSPHTASRCCGHGYITVTAPPQAADDDYVAIANHTRTIPAPGVLGNDRADFAVAGDGAEHGSVVVGRRGRIDYTPDPGFTGTDTFTYEARVQGEQPDTATVTMRVKNGNTAPVALDDAYDTDEDIPILEGAPGVMANDYDPDGDPLTAELLSEPFANNFIFSGDGGFEFEPYFDYDSPSAFTYRVYDGHKYSDPATATIDVHFVNDPPVGVEDTYDSGGSGTITVGAPGVLANDYDPVESDALIARRVSRPQAGTLDFNSDGSFSYTFGANTSAYFAYRVVDSGGAVGDRVSVGLYR